MLFRHYNLAAGKSLESKPLRTEKCVSQSQLAQTNSIRQRRKAIRKYSVAVTQLIREKALQYLPCLAFLTAAELLSPYLTGTAILQGHQSRRGLNPAPLGQ